MLRVGFGARQRGSLPAHSSGGWERASESRSMRTHTWELSARGWYLKPGSLGEVTWGVSEASKTESGAVGHT